MTLLSTPKKTTKRKLLFAEADQKEEALKIKMKNNF